ncbi:MAG: hypothetical protein MZV64_63480 [Ignavibacteriales bacterium]|nr:hypothetical protein [Ignavibacteriales bacterium]
MSSAPERRRTQDRAEKGAGILCGGLDPAGGGRRSCGREQASEVDALEGRRQESEGREGGEASADVGPAVEDPAEPERHGQRLERAGRIGDGDEPASGGGSAEGPDGPLVEEGEERDQLGGRARFRGDEEERPAEGPTGPPHRPRRRVRSCRGSRARGRLPPWGTSGRRPRGPGSSRPCPGRRPGRTLRRGRRPRRPPGPGRRLPAASGASSQPRRSEISRPSGFQTAGSRSQMRRTTAASSRPRRLAASPAARRPGSTISILPLVGSMDVSLSDGGDYISTPGAG